MKKNFPLLAVLFFCIFAIQANAQPDPWEWDSYNMKFALPKGCKVTKSTGDAFEASKTGFSVGIYPFKDASVTHDNLADATLKLAKELKYSSIEDGGEVDLNGYEGYYVEGTKSGIRAIILSLLDADSDDNFFVVIAYAPDMEDYALIVLKSFQKM
jgi:hypothetical protein